jgi:uncharacterized membrane protein
MDPAYYGLIEMALVFGGVLAYCAYGIWSIDRRRAARAEAERAAATALARDASAPAVDPDPEASRP